MNRKLYRKKLHDTGLGVGFEEVLCTPTGRWMIENRNGESTLHIEIEHSSSHMQLVTEEVERKYFKFLGKKKVKKWITTQKEYGLWVPEDELIYVDTTINECGK